MKEIFLDSHRRLKGPYADNPFEKRTARTGQSLSTDLLKGLLLVILHCRGAGGDRASLNPRDVAGADAFPSQTSLLRLGQALSKSVPPTAPSTRKPPPVSVCLFAFSPFSQLMIAIAVPTFGASSSLFGATKPTSSTFSFAPASSTATPFFKPFATPTSIAATTAAPSLFGQ
jgi:hypothetical protein